jgi:hypothetical protein
MTLQNLKINLAGRILWPAILILLLWLHVWGSLHTLAQNQAFAGDTGGGPDYYPLQVGNEWEFEGYHYKDGSQTSHRKKIMIVSKQDLGTGMTQYYSQKNEEFLIKSKEGILTPAGVFLLKYPLTRGEKWVSGHAIFDQRLFRIDETGLSITVRGTTYNNCIRVIVTSDFHATLIKGKTTYVSFELFYNYAPNVGPVLVETFEIKRSGGRRLVSRTELVSFKTKQPIKEERPPIAKPTKLIKPKESFRFPQDGFTAPCLSPDDNWLVYFRFGHGFWARDEWDREMYYTERGRTDQKLVPFCPQAQIRNVRSVNRRPKWSPDGRILATLYEIGYDEWIGLTDFSGDKPVFVESFRGDSPLIWISDRSFLCLDGFGNIMKKEPGRPSEPAVFFRSSYRGRDYARMFQFSSDGTIIYTDGRGSVYLTNMADPSKRTPLFYNPKKEKSNTQSLRLSSVYDLSPSGKHAVFYLRKKEHNSRRMAVLANLKTVEVIDRFSVREHQRALWSPDGTKLAYLEDTIVHTDRKDPSKRVWPNPHFFVLDLKTGERQDFGIGVSREFNWTPDSKHILYSMKYAHESLTVYKNGIFIMRVSDGKEIGQLTKISAHSLLYMSPSCKCIVWEALDTEKFFVVENPFTADMLKE